MALGGQRGTPQPEGPSLPSPQAALPDFEKIYSFTPPCNTTWYILCKIQWSFVFEGLQTLKKCQLLTKAGLVNTKKLKVK